MAFASAVSSIGWRFSFFERGGEGWGIGVSG